MRKLALAALLGTLLGAGCRQPAAPPPGDLEEVLHPDLSAVEEVARRQLAEGRSRLERLLAKGADRSDIADAFGGLGELYHAYRLLLPAAACYRNAERLDRESFLWPYYLGVVYQAEGDLDAARRSLERALELRSDDGPARLRRSSTSQRSWSSSRRRGASTTPWEWRCASSAATRRPPRRSVARARARCAPPTG